MTDWLIFIAALIAYAWAIWSYHHSVFPPDPKRWKSPGLQMSIRDGKIHFRRSPRP